MTTACGQPSTVLDNTTEHTVFICISFKECRTDLTAVLVTDCNTQEQCSPGTIVETFSLCVQEFSARGAAQPVAPAQPAPEIVQPAAAAQSAAGAAQPVAAIATSPICAALQNGKTAADRRILLCTALSGRCRPAPADSCLLLATVVLNANGTIGTVDTCTYRARVYNNTVLLDLILCLADRIEQCCASAKPCLGGFPVGYNPFANFNYVSGPDASGDFVIVGNMTGASWTQFLKLPLPDMANQIYCDPVIMQPDSNVKYIAYVPSAQERLGDFSNFKLPLTDPKTGQPFVPDNVIPQAEWPSAAQEGTFAWRVRSVVP